MDQRQARAAPKVVGLERVWWAIPDGDRDDQIFTSMRLLGGAMTLAAGVFINALQRQPQARDYLEVPLNARAVCRLLPMERRRYEPIGIAFTVEHAGLIA
jgi:hypothetical protein